MGTRLVLKFVIKKLTTEFGNISELGFGDYQIGIYSKGEMQLSQIKTAKMF